MGQGEESGRNEGGQEGKDGEAGLKGILMRSCARAQTRRERREGDECGEGVCALKTR